MTSDEAFELILGHEGKYSNHPADPGGETMYGITARVARRHGYLGNMRYLPLAKAKEIFTLEYWLGVRANQLPAELRFDMVDFGYNSDPRRAIQFLQEILDVDPDGVLGPVTLAALSKVDPIRTCAVLSGKRLLFLADLHTWNQFGKGWARRVAHNLVRLK